MATELKMQGRREQAKKCFAMAEGILQRIIDNKLKGDSAIGTTDEFGALYYFAAGCRQEQRNWDGAIQYFQKVVSDYPYYERACGAQAAIEYCGIKTIAAGYSMKSLTETELSANTEQEMANLTSPGELRLTGRALFMLPTAATTAFRFLTRQGLM